MRNFFNTPFAQCAKFGAHFMAAQTSHA
ncbi:MAG: hypothetical protein UU76_C0022G0001, partial [Parcubacteria group bacterium GW2011_GWC1_41_7]